MITSGETEAVQTSTEPSSTATMSSTEEATETATMAPTTESRTLTIPPTDVPVLRDCHCTSHDKNALTAEQCDQNGNCQNCNDTSSCGKFDVEYFTNCSKVCGVGTWDKELCFIWANGTKDCEIFQTDKECDLQACPELCMYSSNSIVYDA